MSGCACGDTRPPRRFGFAATTFRDLGPDGRAVQVEARRQRLACRRCGMTSSEMPVPMRVPFRVTERLAGAVVDEALRTGFAGACDLVGVDERTVRDLVAAETTETLAAADAGMPADVLVRVWAGGDRRLALAHDAACGRLANAYPDPFDARLAATLAGAGKARVHVDALAAGPALSLVPAKAGVTLHRASATEALSRLLPACLALLANELDQAGRRALKAVRGALAKPPAAVSLAEQAALAEAAAEHPLIDAFAAARGGLLGVFASPVRKEADAAHDAWRRSLGTVLRRVFRPALRWLDEWGAVVLNRGYGKVPLSAWRTACAVEPAVRPHDTPERTILRTLRALPDRRQRAPAPGREPGMRVSVRPRG